MAAHDLQVVRSGIARERVVGREVAMADVQLVGHQPDVAQQLDRGHLVLADDVEHLVDVVGGMDGDRQVAFLRRHGRFAHQCHGAGLDLPRDQDALHAAVLFAGVALDELERQVEFPLAGGLVHPAVQPAARPGDPAAAVEARAEIGAQAQFAHDLQQGLLHAQLAAELDEGGDAVAEQLGDREACVEVQLLRGGVVVGADVARVAADAGADAGDADLVEGLSEVVRAADVRDEPVRRAVPGMDVGVDEAGTDQLATRVDLPIHAALEALADEQHGRALEHQLGVAPQCVPPFGVADEPAAGDPGPHVTLSTI